MAQIHLDIAQGRQAGLSYQALADKFGLHRQSVRNILKIAEVKGLGALEKMRAHPQQGTKTRIPDEEYNKQWIARVKARCITDEKGCLLWQGFIHPKGYGLTNYRERGVRVHRAMYMAHHNTTLTPDQVICHTCDVRNCCNPLHLFLGTFDTNNKDIAAKGRCKYSAKAWPNCKHGHPFTPENTYIAKTGFRQCRTCAKIKSTSEEYRAKARERARLKRLSKRQQLSPSEEPNGGN